MLTQVADGVFVHESEFCKSNAVVVQGRTGVLLVDPGLRDSEMTRLADDVRALGSTVVAGFSTHPHWDHLLWHERFGAAPRYGTARCAAAIHARLADPDWRSRVTAMMPPDLVDQVPLHLLGQITGLPAGTARIPWDGPAVRILEHQAHAPGHAALLIEERGVLVAGDMLSDVLVPLLDLMNAADPVGDYLTALRLLEGAAAGVEVVIPGHGTVGGTEQVRARIEQDRAYVQAMGDGGLADDPRIGPSAVYDWVAGVHARQLGQLARKAEREGTSG